MSDPLDLPDDDILPLSLQRSFWTWSALSRVDPTPVVRAQGVHFWDAPGKRYLDFNSMVMCSNIGRRSSTDNTTWAIVRASVSSFMPDLQRERRPHSCWDRRGVPNLRRV